MLFSGVFLNESKYVQIMWNEVSNWIMVGYEGNVAVPHVEMLPCQYDEVVFPAGLQTSRVYFNVFNTKVKRFKFGKDYWNNDDLQFYLKQDLISGKYLLCLPSSFV